MSRLVIPRKPPGQIRDAIIGYLKQCGRDASVAEIREAVASCFRGELAESSVRSYLRLNSSTNFERVAPGRYRWKDDAADAPLFENIEPSQTKHLKSSDGDDPKDRKRAFRPIFRHGRATLYEADCMEWLAARSERTIEAIVTDPPYGLVEYSPHEQAKLRAGKGGVWRIPPSFDGHQRSPLPRFTVLEKRDLDKLYNFFLRWARECYRVLVPGGHVAVASNPLLSFKVSAALSDAGFERRGEVIRLVMTMRGGDRPKNAHEEFPNVSVMPRSMWEPWLLFRKPCEGRVQDNLRKWKTGGLRRPSAEKPFGDVIVSGPTRPAERKIAPHPSLKPQAFLRQLVRAMLPLAEGIVLDPFAGSGSTLAAAEAVGYSSIGLENDPHYVEVAREAMPRLCTYGVPGADGGEIR